MSLAMGEGLGGCTTAGEYLEYIKLWTENRQLTGNSGTKSLSPMNPPWSEQPVEESVVVEARCHGELLRFYRRQRGWTQLELARRAGYSERAVRSAEKGGVVRRSTLVALATALSTPTEPLSPADLTSDPLAVCQAFMRGYFRYRENAGQACRHLLHPEIQMVIHTGSDTLGFGGTFVGPDGVDQMIRTAYTLVVPVEEEFGRWYASGNRVAAMRRQWLCPADNLTGPRTEVWILHEYQVADGVIARIDTYFDSQAYERGARYGPSPAIPANG